MWIVSLGASLILAAQCSSQLPPNPTPPLPPPISGPTITIALLSPSSGEMGTFGRLMRNGAIMAFDQYNAKGGLLDHPIEWRVYDTQCEFEAAQQAARQAVEDGLTFFIGPLCSEAAIGAAAVAQAHQILMISPTATHPAVTIDGQGRTRSMVFRASYVSEWQGQAAARFARNKLIANKAALLSDPADDYAAAISQAFVQTFTTEGGSIVYEGSYQSGQDDLNDMLAAIGQAEAEVIYLPAPADVTGRIAQRLNNLESLSTIPLLGSDRWDSDQLDVEAISGAYFTTHFLTTNETPSVRSWIQTYKAAYAVEPDTLAALGYDAANLLLSATERAGAFEPEAIAQTLRQGSFSGVTGPITFDPQHNPQKPVPVARIDQQRKDFFTIILPGN